MADSFVQALVGDPVAQQVLAGIIVNALSAIASRVKIGRKKVGTTWGTDGTLSSILSEAASKLDRGSVPGQEWNEELWAQVDSFMKSPELALAARRTLCARLVRDTEALADVRAELVSALRIRLTDAQEFPDIMGVEVFDVLVAACDWALQKASENKVIADELVTLRQQLLLEELSSVKRSIALLAGIHRPDFTAIVKFEETYRAQTCNRHGHITPPHFDQARKIPIDQLYVIPMFYRAPRSKRGEVQRIGLPELLGTLHRTVVLGNPGGGKSTLAQKLCHDMARQSTEKPLSSGPYTPILVVLREYGAAKKEKGVSILQFIEAQAAARYQVQPPSMAFEYLLLTGRAAVVFDGLDELLDTSYRQEVSGDVENFCSLYPSVPVLVTSREVGYEQAPLDPATFEVFRLAPLEDAQVAEYAEKWFALDSDLTPAQQQQKVSGFLAESETAPDLRSNPLMLALMCNLYRGENYIPKNRPDLYEKCAVMLFERWDKGRGIHVPLPFEAHVRPAMMYLAHWIYGDEHVQGGITEEHLVHRATDYLFPRRFEDRDEAAQAARQFIQFCRGRAWVFTDTGTTPDGEKLYQFTHRTFLEYFAASYLVRTNVTPEALVGVLCPRIIRGEWDVVSQLAFQIQNKNAEGAGDALLSHLVECAQTSDLQPAANLLVFSSRCLEFMVPSPSVSRLIASASLEWCIRHRWSEPMPQPDQPHWRRLALSPTALLSSLMRCSVENRSAVAGLVESYLGNLIHNGTDQHAIGGFEITLFMWRVTRSPRRLRRLAYPETWSNVAQRVLQTGEKRYRGLWPKSLVLCLEAFHSGVVSISDVVTWHGFQSLFVMVRNRMGPGMRTASVIDVIVQNILSTSQSSRRALARDLSEFGKVAFQSKPPWVVELDSPYITDWTWIWHRGRGLRATMENVPPGADPSFGLFAVGAISAEIDSDWVSRNTGRNKAATSSPLERILAARFNVSAASDIEIAMDLLQLDDNQKQFVWRWIRREFNLVEGSPKIVDEVAVTAPSELE